MRPPAGIEPWRPVCEPGLGRLVLDRALRPVEELRRLFHAMSNAPAEDQDESELEMSSERRAHAAVQPAIAAAVVARNLRRLKVDL